MSDSAEPIRRLFGVPFSAKGREKFTETYLSRFIAAERRLDGKRSDIVIREEAKRKLRKFVEDLLHQYAGRSQTLLAVVALANTLFITIVEKESVVRLICIFWAFSSITLLYNIYIRFMPDYLDMENDGDYDYIIKLLYWRCTIFNANVFSSLVFSVSCLFVYVNELDYVVCATATGCTLTPTD